MALLPRRILFELITTTLFALAAISLLMTFVLAMVEAGRHGMDPFSLLALSPYMVPTLLPYTIPVCLLYACVSVYGGMSGANEVVAAKAAGIHVMRLLQPAFLLAVGAVCLGVFLTDRVIPQCNLRLRQVLWADLESAVLNYLRINNGRLVGDGANYEIAVESVKGNKLIGPIFVHKNAEGETIANIKAKEATLRVVGSPTPGEPPQIKVTLFDVIVRVIKGAQGQVRMGEETLPMPVPAQLWKSPEKKLDCLSYKGCWDRAQEMIGKAKSMEGEESWRGAVALLNGAPLPFAQHVLKSDPKLFQQQVNAQAQRARSAIGEMHVRGNHALAALPFVLLGCPISVLLSRKDPLQTFFYCFGPIIAVYYPSVILTQNIFKEGGDDASFIWGQALMWAPSVGMLFAAAIAVNRLVRT